MSYIRHKSIAASHYALLSRHLRSTAALPGALAAQAVASARYAILIFAYAPSMHLLALNKPFGTICQFSPHETRASLADWVKVPGVYPAGRLDSDSEGLLLLTDDGALQARIAEPRHKLVKRYWAQVEGAVDAATLKKLARGVDLGDYVTRPCRAEYVAADGRALDTHAADPLSRRDPDHVDRAVDHRRQEPPGAPHDSRGGIPDAATSTCRHRRARYFFAGAAAGRECRIAVEGAVGRYRVIIRLHASTGDRIRNAPALHVATKLS